MNYHASPIAVGVFVFFVGVVLGISFYLGKRAKTAQGYFAAHGQIGWFVNGVAFAGDYLSAASFLGICGMIAFYGYDGFLYSIGYLAGWVVALFVIPAPEQVKPVAATQPSEIPYGGQVVSIGGGHSKAGDSTGPLGPVAFLSRINDVKIVQWTSKLDTTTHITTYTPVQKDVRDLMLAGG